MAESLNDVPGIPDKVKVFIGLMTKEGRLRLYQSEHSDFFGLLGGEIKNGPDCLEPGLLLKEASQEANRVGVEIADFPVPIIYHMISEDCWSFIIPVCYGYWKEKEESGRQFLDIEPDDFDVCRVLGFFEDRTHRLGGLVCFFCVYGESDWGVKAAELIARTNPEWETGLYKDPYYDLANLAKIREKI